MNLLFQLAHEFSQGWNDEKIGEKKRARAQKKRGHKPLSEQQLDKRIQASFPASDPPGTY